MTTYASIRTALVLFGALLATVACNAKAGTAVPVPAPVLDAARAGAPARQTAVVAGGCFWGIQAVFQHVKGVISATSGYSGGSAKTAEYEIVSTGETGHAESVEIVYDPSQITYGQLLRVFFSVAHDPTQLNRQGRTKVRNTVPRFSMPTMSRSALPRLTSPNSTMPGFFLVRW